MAELFDQLVTLNPCPVTAATYLEALACVTDTLHIRSDRNLENLAKLSGHTTTEPILSKKTLETISTKTQSTWNLLVCGGSSLEVRPCNRSTDCLLAALARLLVLLEHLENNEESSKAWPQGILLEARNGGEIALESALQQVSRMLDRTNLYNLYSLDTYIRLLVEMPGSASKRLAMDCLTRTLVRKASAMESMSTDLKIEEQTSINLLYNILDTRMSDPLLLDSSLKLRGALLAYHYTLVGSLDTALVAKLETWIRTLKLAGHERSVRPP